MVTCEDLEEPAPALTDLLNNWQAGNTEALEELMGRVHGDLREIAAARLRPERRNHTLQPTALVNETYLRLVDQTRVSWKGRAHFFAVASTIMRRILVDHARARSRKKREAVHVTLHGDLAVTTGVSVDLLALDAAMNRLQEEHSFEAEVVQLRFFGGLTIPECAEHLDVGHATVERAWTFARAWLFRELSRY